MWLDLVVAAILAASLVAGAVRGMLVSSVRLGGAIAAYVAGWMLAPRVAPMVEARTDLAGTLAVLVAGLGLFMAFLLTREVATAAVKALERRLRSGPRPAADRLAGAVVSSLAGFAFAVLIGWLAISVDALRIQTGNDALPSLEGSRFAPIAQEVIERAAGRVLADRGPAGRAVAHAVADPAVTLDRVEELIANPHLGGLKNDAGFWTEVEQGHYEAATRRSSFLAVAYDDTTRRQLADLGLIDERAARSSRAFRDSAQEALAAIGPRLRALREDPAMERLASDPEIQEMVLANDTLGLLRHPDVRQVIHRALAPPSA